MHPWLKMSKMAATHSITQGPLEGTPLDFNFFLGGGETVSKEMHSYEILYYYYLMRNFQYFSTLNNVCFHVIFLLPVNVKMLNKIYFD